MNNSHFVKTPDGEIAFAYRYNPKTKEYRLIDVRTKRRFAIKGIHLKPFKSPHLENDKEYYSMLASQLENETYKQIFFKSVQEEAAMRNQDRPESHAALYECLMEAYNQSAFGKGQNRHGRGLKFEEQPIIQIPIDLQDGSIDGLIYQILKKSQETGKMAKEDKLQQAIDELSGVIVYAAAAKYILKQLQEKRADDEQ